MGEGKVRYDTGRQITITYMQLRRCKVKEGEATMVM